MILSYIVYTGVSIMLGLLGWHLNRRDERLLTDSGRHLPFLTWEMVAMLFVVTVIMALRYNTGSDHHMYLMQYYQMCKFGEFGRPGFEPGFKLITQVIALTGAHYTIYFGIWALLQAFLLYYGLRRRLFLLPWLGAVLFMGPYAINWLSFMRQWTVAMALVMCLPLLAERSWRNFALFALVVVLSSTIHKSSILLLALYALPYKSMAKGKLWVYLAIYAACVLIGLRPYWMTLFRPLGDRLLILGYDKYDYLLMPLLNGYMPPLHFGPLRVLTILSHLVFVCFFPQVRRMFADDKFVAVAFSLAFIGVCYEGLMINTCFFLVRPSDYFYIFAIIMLCYTFACLWRQRKLVALAATLAIVVGYMFVSVFKSVYLPSDAIAEVIKYKFFFMKH